MQHYQFHIGDYAQATAHLSDMEDLTYRRLIDLYYSKELPLSLDLKTICRRARVKMEHLTVILEEFFTQTEHGYTHLRCDTELEKIYAKSELARISVGKRKDRLSTSVKNKSTNVEQLPTNVVNLNTDDLRTAYEPLTNDLLPVTRNPLTVTREPVTQDPEVQNQEDSKTLQSASPPAKKRKVVVEIDTELQNVCRATWTAYGLAYQDRYGVAPVRNAKVSGQVKQFCQRIPHTEAPLIAGFYVWHNQSFYVTKGHPIGLMLNDAEKLRTEWATNTKITTSQAQLADVTEGMGQIWRNLDAKLEAQNGQVN